MRFWSAIPVVLALVAPHAFADGVTGPVIDPAQDQVVPASCRSSDLGDGWCDCELIGPDGSTYESSISCSATLCYHMQDWSDIPGCLSPPDVATCELSHGDVTCSQRVGIDGVKVPTAEDACDYVLSRLNYWDTGDPVFYCGNTYLRGGWTLDGIQ
jgi:hypothetical protein